MRCSETKFIELFDSQSPLALESGETLAPVLVAYETYGALDAGGANAILICHALTANAHAAGFHAGANAPGWWNGLIGEGNAFDTSRYFVVCSNILGSCYGTTGPASLDPKTGGLYRMSFPQITIRDMVRVQKALLDALGVTKLAAVAGGSLGGMQVLEWGIMYPNACERLVPISTSAKQSAWCIALNTVARAAMTGDPDWHRGFYVRQPRNGLGLARMIGMISYRSPVEFEQRFGSRREQPETDRWDFDNRFEVEGYLRHQGEKLADRFDANTYICISRAMDLHDVGYGRGGVGRALGSIRAKVLCIGFDTDLRYPAEEQRAIVLRVPDGMFVKLGSLHGHDAFLIEFAKMNAVISDFLKA